MKFRPIAALAAILSAGIPACSLYDPNMTAAWEQPIPATPSALNEGETPVAAAQFANPADQIEADLLALERIDAVPVLERHRENSPPPEIVNVASAPEALVPNGNEIPVPNPPAKLRKLAQPPVIIAGSGTPAPATVGAPPSDPVVAEIQTDSIVPREEDPFKSSILTLDPLIDSPPSLDYGVKLSKGVRPLATE